MKKQIILVTSLMLLSFCDSTQCEYTWGDRCCDGYLLISFCNAAMMASRAVLDQYSTWQYCRSNAATDICVNDSNMQPDTHLAKMVLTTGYAVCFSAMAACFAKKTLKRD